MAELKSAHVTTITGEVGQHSYSIEETESFAEFINSHPSLSKDEHLSDVIPLKKPTDLFEAVKDGVLLCKLINVAVPNTIDERVMNVKKKKNPWEKNENHCLAINSAKAIGCSTVNVGQIDLNEGRPHIVLGIVWQIIKISLFQDINLKQHPELVRLLKDGETLADLLKLPPEQILLRWMNYHLDRAGSKRRVNNFSSDIKDSEAYTLVLNQICPNKECTLAPMNEQNTTERAEKMLQEAAKIGCRKFVQPRDVVAGNNKLNLAFVAHMFNTYPALEAINKDDYDFAELMEFDAEGTREERAFRMWIQSLGLDCNHLFSDMKDGLLLCKIFDKVEPGCVDWKQVEQKPKNKFHMIQNTNYAVKLADKLKLSTVNIGGVDIYEGKKKIILAVIWQLMRYNLLKMLKEIGGGKNVTEDDLVKFANEKVTPNISSLKDGSLKSGVYLCRLCHAIAPKSCNPDFITEGETPEDASQNAKYAISVARKIGAVVFCVPEDIVEVKTKMIFSFVASLNLVYLKGQKSE